MSFIFLLRQRSWPLTHDVVKADPALLIFLPPLHVNRVRAPTVPFCGARGGARALSMGGKRSANGEAAPSPNGLHAQCKAALADPGLQKQREHCLSYMPCRPGTDCPSLRPERPVGVRQLPPRASLTSGERHVKRLCFSHL